MRENRMYGSVRGGRGVTRVPTATGAQSAGAHRRAGEDVATLTPQFGHTAKLAEAVENGADSAGDEPSERDDA
jgi:hypothetical protein